MRRTSYQQGSLKLAERRKGKVWEFRWREVQIDGSVRRKNIVIGTLEEFPNESAAQAAVDAIRLEINQQTPQQLIKNISLETLVNHYRQYELPDIFNKTKPRPDAADEDRKSYATQVTYEGYLKKWIVPRWGACRLIDVKAIEVEKWLKTLCFKKTGVALARGSKAKIRNIMSALFSHAIRWEWADKNPITSVRQSAKRQKAPDVLIPEEIVAILGELPNPLRMMIELDAFTGLRRGELIGLRSEIGSCDGGGSAKNGGIAKRCAVGRANCRVAFRVAANVPIPWYGRLGIWITGDERQTAVLAWHAMEVLRQACAETGQNHQTRDVSHFPAHIWNAPECKRGESKGRARTASSRQHEGDHGRLYAGCQPSETGGPEQAGENGHEDRFSLTGPNWTMKKTGDAAELLYFVGVPDGI